MNTSAGSWGLTVGQVAKRTGMTVRTLHHYDAIGLVRPQGRSASGYRIYSAGDIERLHAVQSLKQLGLGLDAIGTTLARGAVTPLDLINRQIADVEHTIEQARQMSEKLRLLRDALLQDNSEAHNGDTLLTGMRLLETYQRFFPLRGIRQLLARWRRARSRWSPLATALMRHQQAGTPVDAPDVQRLAQQWMNVAMIVFGGQLRTVQQWAHMHRLAPETAAHAGLSPKLLGYLEGAIAARLAALARHLSSDDLARLDGSLTPEWEQFAKDGTALLKAGTPAHAPQARQWLARYIDLLGRTVRHDAVLAEKMRRAYGAEPILAHGHFVSAELRAYLERISA